MFSVDLRHLLPDSQPPGLFAVSLILSLGACLPVLCPVHSTTSVYQRLWSDFRVGTPEGCVHPSLSGRLAGHC